MVDVRSMFVGMTLGIIGTILFMGSVSLGQVPLSGPDDAGGGPPAQIQARIDGGDWGAVRVTARSGQRIPATLSLSEVTRVAFEDDQVSSVRAAQAGRPGAPSVDFERDERTGDLYIVVTEGLANQVVSTFVTTARGHTYQILWTIRDMPAAQLFIRGQHVVPGGRPSDGGRASAHDAAIVEFAQYAFQADPQDGRDRPEEVVRGVYVTSLGVVGEGAYQGHVFAVENRSDAAITIDHAVFVTSDTVAVASALDIVSPGGVARVIVIEPRGADHE